jgi:hypothetical protein
VSKRDAAILDSIWTRIQTDFLFVNPQLSDWLEGSTLEKTAEKQDGKPVYRLTVVRGVYADGGGADWLDVHVFTICRSLSVELQRPVVVRVVAREGVK